MINIVGWIGTSLLAFCSFPQMMKSIKDGNSDGLSHGFLWMWFLGEVFTLVYVLPKMDYPLLLNYGFNVIMISIIVYYKYKPREKSE